MNRLSIIIVSFNAAPDLARCLDSLVQHPPQHPHEILVVDNASGDGSGAVAAQRGARVLALHDNVGFARANNVGIRATSGALVLLLNGDTLVPRGALDRLVSALEAEPSAAAAGPRLVDARGDVELSWGPMISPLGELRQKLRLRLHERGVGPVAAGVARDAHRRRFVDWVSGACLLVWRRDAEAVGLLDERYFMYTEDVDFCAALRRHGRRVLFTPDAEIVHLRGRSRASVPALVEREYRRSKQAFYDKHHPRWASVQRWYSRLIHREQP